MLIFRNRSKFDRVKGGGGGAMTHAAPNPPFHHVFESPKKTSFGSAGSFQFEIMALP
jgi:hypothetical protein